MKIYRIAEDIDAIYYHVTLTSNIASILENGLNPSTPDDMEDENGVYMFRSLDDVHNALMNWLGERYEDRYGEDIDLAILSIDSRGVSNKKFNQSVGYEIMSYNRIPPEFIRVVETGQ